MGAVLTEPRILEHAQISLPTCVHGVGIPRLGLRYIVTYIPLLRDMDVLLALTFAVGSLG